MKGKLLNLEPEVDSLLTFNHVHKSLLFVSLYIVYDKQDKDLRLNGFVSAVAKTWYVIRYSYTVTDSVFSQKYIMS